MNLLLAYLFERSISQNVFKMLFNFTNALKCLPLLIMLNFKAFWIFFWNDFRDASIINNDRKYIAVYRNNLLDIRCSKEPPQNTHVVNNAVCFDSFEFKFLPRCN